MTDITTVFIVIIVVVLMFFFWRTPLGYKIDLLGQGENVAIYEPPKTGKMSLVQQTFYNMKVATQRFSVTEFSLIGTRSVSSLLVNFGTTVLKAAYATPSEYADAVERLLQGTHFVFDPVA